MEGKRTKKVANYFITSNLLGQGAFSKVFMAYNQQQQPLAVKVIPREGIQQSSIESFESEINTLRHCKHQNIVNFMDVKKSQTNFYIFLQYCEGGNLADYIKKHKTIQEEQALNIFGQLIRGMNMMRTSKIVHRDLKSANIMFKNGKVKIVDFGLAKKFSKNQMLKTFAGTPFNMAPQILKGYLYNQKVDVYSAGTVLYQMLFGVYPYTAKNIQTIIKQIQLGKLQGEKMQNVNVSSDVKNLLRQMLQPEPQNRIDLSQVLDFMQTYQIQKRKQKIDNYRQMSMRSKGNIGAIGSLAGCFDFSASDSKSFNQMDLRMYAKYCRRLSPELIANV